MDRIHNTSACAFCQSVPGKNIDSNAMHRFDHFGAGCCSSDADQFEIPSEDPPDFFRGHLCFFTVYQFGESVCEHGNRNDNVDAKSIHIEQNILQTVIDADHCSLKQIG